MSDSSSAEPPPDRLGRALATNVHVDDRDRPFAELGPEQARSLAAALGDLPIAMRARVGPISLAWKELAGELESESRRTVAELEPERVIAYAERLWVIPPPSSILGPEPERDDE